MASLRRFAWDAENYKNQIFKQQERFILQLHQLLTVIKHFFANKNKVTIKHILNEKKKFLNNYIIFSFHDISVF